MLKVTPFFPFFPPPRGRLTAPITWVNKQTRLPDLYLFNGTAYNSLKTFGSPRNLPKAKTGSFLSPQISSSPTPNSSRDAQRCQRQKTIFPPVPLCQRLFLHLFETAWTKFLIRSWAMHWGSSLLHGKTAQGACHQFLQSCFREAVRQVDKRMRKWRKAKRREGKKQPLIKLSVYLKQL